MTPEEARSRFAWAPIARLATVGANGAPHVVPITFAMDGDRIISAVDAKQKRGTALRRLANITSHPRVSVLVDHYQDDWQHLWWVRADGLARIVADGHELERAFDLLRDRYEQYRHVALIGPVVVVDVDRWTGWSAAPLD